MKARFLLTAASAGALFAIGLGVAQMTLPSRVLGFLDFTGDWDPTLAFVLAAAVAVYAGIRRLADAPRPVLAGEFSVPTRRDVDARLVVGSAMFGVGWGLVGLCPGPALTLTAVAPHATAFIISMIAGSWLVGTYDRRRMRAAA